MFLAQTHHHHCLPPPFRLSHRSLPLHQTPSSSPSHRTRIRASWQEVAGVVIFSAIPFTAVKVIAGSPIGEGLRRRLEERKSVEEREAGRRKALAEDARKKSCWYGEQRPRWLGPLPFDYPAHLDGQLPGDYGFDLAELGKDSFALQRYFNFEILHARWAMLAAVGVVIPELLDAAGSVNFAEPVWWRVGYSKLQGDTLDYLGIPGLHIAGSQGVLIIAVCQFLLMVHASYPLMFRNLTIHITGWIFNLVFPDGFCLCDSIEWRICRYAFECYCIANGSVQVGPEYARYCGIKALEPLGVYLPGDINYPGGILFDPLNLSKDPVAFEELKIKEIKNGRLAMFAWLGFFIQAAVTGKGPIQNLLEHLSDPFHNNLISALQFMSNTS